MGRRNQPIIIKWQLPDDVVIGTQLTRHIERYRATYLGFFLDRFQAMRGTPCRGGYFNINSVTGEPYDHNYCYSWTDGRSLAELCAAYLADLGDPTVIRQYVEHLYGALVERYELNGYFPHVVEDRTNLAVDDPMNVPVEAGRSSFSHVFVLDGLFQYGLLFDDASARKTASKLLEELRQALHQDQFLEGARLRPTGQRAQGPFMIALGVVVDVLETMATRFGGESAEFAGQAGPFLTLGRECLDYILSHHHRPEDNAFWEVSANGEAAPDTEGRVVTDPGHTIEFAGFAARFAAFLDAAEQENLIAAACGIFHWAAQIGFHPTRDLVYKNVDRDTGRPIKNERVDDISKLISPRVFEGDFDGQPQPAEIATFPWWVPMELLAAGSILRHGDDSGATDRAILRATRGLFRYYPNHRIGGLCYQSIGDGFFGYVDIPPATASLDLMHSHRSMRVFLREVDGTHA